MKQFTFIIIAAFFTLAGYSQEKLYADREKSFLEWTGEGVARLHVGTISLQDGWLIWQDNKIISGEFTIDMSSLKDSKGTEKLERHLKSADFFDVEKFPVSKLVISGSTTFEKGSGSVKGTLTIKGNTRPIEFKAARQEKDDGTWFYSHITFDRSEYNVRYGSGTFFDNLGDRTIYDDIKLKVNLLVKRM